MASLEPDTASGLSSWLHWSQTRRQDCLRNFIGDSQTRLQDGLLGFTGARHSDSTVFVASASLEPDTAPGLSSWLHWSQTRRQDCLHDFTGDTQTQRQDCLHGFTGDTQTRRQDCLHGFTRTRHGARTVLMASLEPDTPTALSSWLH